MKKISLLAIACIALVSCDPNEGKTENGGDSDSSINWWLRSQLAPEGVKSITEIYDENNSRITEYDRQGRPTTIKSINGRGTTTETFNYTQDGQLKSYTDIYQDGEISNKSTTIYEYGNTGKFLPTFGQIRHLNETGLVAGLSKITDINANGDTSTCVMTFISDTQLQIINSFVDWADTSLVRYEGGYPVEYYDGLWYYCGPNTYQSNGMFKEYREGFKAPGETPSNARTYKYRTDYDKAMLLSIFEEETPYDHTVTTYEYDNKGNLTKEVTNYYGTSKEYNNTTTFTYTYEFDNRGNWTRRDVNIEYSNDNYKNSYTNERKILYY